MPRSITASGRPARPTSPRMPAMTAAGMTTRPMAGTPRMFARRPYCDIWLKWKAEIGAVARPATNEVTATPITGFAKRQDRPWVRRHQSRWRSHSKVAISAAVAAKDIWNPASVTLSGRITEDDHRRERDRAQAEGRPVDQHRDEDHRCHDEGALGGDAGAREEQVGEAGGERGGGGDLLERQAQGEDRHQREAVADQAEDEAGQEAHVQAGDREQMREVGGAQIDEGAGIDAGAVAGQDRGGEAAVLARDRRLDGARHAQAEAVDQLPPAARAVGLGLDHRRSGVAHGAEPREPGHLAEVEAAGFRRGGGRRQAGLADDALAGLQGILRGRLVDRDADLCGRAFRFQPVDHHAVEQHARAVRDGAVEPDDAALDGHRHLPRQHGRGDRPAAPGHGGEAEPRHDQEDEQEARRGPDPPGRQGEQDDDRAERGEHPGFGFGRDQEIGSDARAEGHRVPEREVRTLSLDQGIEPRAEHVPCSPDRISPTNRR
jgi:hypothetical protein